MTTPPRFIDAQTAALDPAEIDAGDVVAGVPKAAARGFAALGSVEIGVWEHTSGTSRDVEADEAFVVLSGRGLVTFETGETLELLPGRLVRLHAGERTIWDVHETIRKVYVTG
ncbi:MAG TPA: cupin domain-containing protein [Nocardioidaceae bacterium]|nr:cupin domain-containing protein [Nocardioidaceae bacterium]